MEGEKRDEGSESKGTIMNRDGEGREWRSLGNSQCPCTLSFCRKEIRMKVPFLKCTGCSLNIVSFPKILKYSGLWPFSVFPRCQCVFTHKARRKPTLQQNLQSSEKSQHLKEKQNI